MILDHDPKLTENEVNIKVQEIFEPNKKDFEFDSDELDLNCHSNLKKLKKKCNSLNNSECKKDLLHY